MDENASVVMSTSFDMCRRPELIFENEKGYFITTGGFPQEIIIRLGKPSTIRSIDLVSIGIGKIEVSSSDSSGDTNWEVFASASAHDADPGEFQRLSLNVPQSPKVRAYVLKISILSSTEQFVVIKSLSVLGNNVK